MILTRKKNKRDFIEIITSRRSVIPVHDKQQGLDFLVSFFSAIRPSRQKDRRSADQNLKRISAELHHHPILLKNLQHALLSQIVDTDLSSALSQSGIPLARGFWQELFGRLRHKLLPPLQTENDFLYTVNRVFFKKSDFRWVEDISVETWVHFFDSIRISFQIDDKRILYQFIQSLKMLAFQISQLGLEKEVLNYLDSGSLDDNPFLWQNYLVHDLEELLKSNASTAELQKKSGDIASALDQCYKSIVYIRQHHSEMGTSLHQTYMLVLLENDIDRMTILVDILDPDLEFDTYKFVSFFKLLVRNENRKNSIREFLSQCLGYLAYQIVEHKGSKGSKYITSTVQEYNNMFVSAMKGGGIISFVAVIKNLLTNIGMPIFWHGFLYSLNYSAGFIAIEETHSTLATKQPAFTASAVASSLDTKQSTHRPNLYSLALTVAKVSRSQFASFLGNLVIVFPGTYLLAWIYDLVTKSKIVSGNEAMALLEAQHPWHSLSLLYACNTGFFLFLSGIIAGYVQNKIQFGHIPERLKTHPMLRNSMSAARLDRLAHYVEHHLGPIIGNIALGFMLGMAGLVVKIFGIPFDIRHITISAGNMAIGVYGLGIENIKPAYLLTVFLGVLGIGFMNFLVSFSLAFIVAVKSRGVRLKDYPEFLGILWRYFAKKPLSFIRPQ
ncbi:MAG: hypothetical protein C5B59_16895 [Bacteroidetes bacterium]|nr:MAG: hypothetical protein C5B59_16895 [Bacteroidota bacterium]